MKAMLHCRTGMFAGARFEIARHASIGKSRQNTIVLTPEIISEVHARIFYDARAEGYVLEDAGSRNGTELDGQRVVRREKLGRLHVITLARTFDFIFQVVEEEEQSSPGQEPVAPAPVAAGEDPAAVHAAPFWSASPIRKKNSAPAVVDNGRTLLEPLDSPAVFAAIASASPERTALETAPPVLGRAASATIFQLLLGEEGEEMQSHTLRAGENLLGRDPECDILVDHPSISRRHALLRVDQRQVVVLDLGSRNHSYVGSRRLTAATAVAPGTTMRFGQVAARLVAG